MILSFSSPLALVQELRKASGISCTSRAPMLEILANTGPVLAHEVLNLILDQKNQTDWIWEHGRNQMVQTLRREISWRLFDALSNQKQAVVTQSSKFLYSWMSRVQMDAVHIETLALALNDKNHPISEQTRRAWLNSISVYFWSQKALSDEHIAQLLPENENDRLPFLDFANSPMNALNNQAALRRVCPHLHARLSLVLGKDDWVADTIRALTWSERVHPSILAVPPDYAVSFNR